MCRIDHGLQFPFDTKRILARHDAHIHIDGAVRGGAIGPVGNAAANRADVDFRNDASAHRLERLRRLVPARPGFDFFNDTNHLDDRIRMLANIVGAKRTGSIYVAAGNNHFEVTGATGIPGQTEIRRLRNQGIISAHSVRNQETAAEPLSVVVRPLVFVYRSAAGFPGNRRESHIASKPDSRIAQGFERDHGRGHQAAIVEYGMA